MKRLQKERTSNRHRMLINLTRKKQLEILMKRITSRIGKKWIKSRDWLLLRKVKMMSWTITKEITKKKKKKKELLEKRLSRRFRSPKMRC